uniref:Uncharacterized protein n=1 Tax=Haptolina brevifila TaxID=156173 RepID=A0A7S2C800_9EUKA|mmetsp:Transcript_21513/g.43583  ORF Transcript_21513/g.43583 Transcript_21513/m.43583 type:complete len:283 (+) Transcript_21513:98-946(+)|eukprot:CAMPEP_0174707376 /NCGR_PEP_ID=MMETSP1094-20130205/9907_1 /TAXON_ID=156173 /ORGANISM="Chrysochromulina brevifilum, Strain UTEX LB 985" /LENGTH=282 /DNA_ID=CAMNT_0015905747 /DNA_START=292 /DNA_END=1143 /DNA_ORIENTATION=-
MQRTAVLLERVVQPGVHQLEFYARWSTEIEKGEMSRNAARFWSQGSRQELLRAGCCEMTDILEEWEEDKHGTRPEEGDAAWFDGDELYGECTFIYQDVELILPAEGFFVEPLPEVAAGERQETERTIPLAELLTESDLAQFTRVSEMELYPDPAPSCWHYTTGWKGNCGHFTLSVAEPVTLRQVLRAQPLYANVWVTSEGQDAHFEGLSFGDDCDVEWDNMNGKSAEFEVAPPDNMRLWRLVGRATGRLMGLYRRASERVYAPGGVGAEHVRREFEQLAGQL